MSTCQNPIDMLSDLLEEVADDDASFFRDEDMSDVSDSDGSDIATPIKPKTLSDRPRRGAVCAEPIVTGYYKEPFWNKQESWDWQLFRLIKDRPVFKDFTEGELQMLVRVMSTHFFYADEQIWQQGDPGDAMFIVLQGSVDSYRLDVGLKKPKHIKLHGVNEIIDEIAVLFTVPRQYTLCAHEQCVLVRLSRVHFMNAVVRVLVYRWWGRQSFLRGASLLEMMEDEQIAKLVDVLKVKSYDAGQMIIRQGEEGKMFFIMNHGEANVWVKTGSDDVQEYRRYHRGDLFGELALLKNVPRAANITAITHCEVLCLSRGQFERLLGPMAQLHQQQYLTDPRKLIADFYGPSDCRGPAGSLKLKGLEPDPARGSTRWFVVYRPTSRDAIAKMLSGAAVGKGLNVKGKSAKQGVLSGYVPFIQISDNKHKPMIEKSPPDARLKLYYKTKATREEALKKLQDILATDTALDIARPVIEMVEDYAPKVFGLDLPEPLLREAYIMRPDLSPVMGWEVGRRSEPAFMDMNLHAVRESSEPRVVLYQFDESDSMNPRGLLIAYAEKYMKPVVSDFDTFLVASMGMDYQPLPQDQIKLMSWACEHTEGILNSLDHNPWTSRWLEVLKRENERGFHPSLPKYGFGDPTSYRLIGDIVSETSPCGAVRHGAECFNFYFPQELDDEFLVIWHGFPEKPWDYKSEKQLREFLTERVAEGFTFPINPVWPVRDKGWFDVLQCLLNSSGGKNSMKAWFPPESGVLERITTLHAQHPNGFRQAAKEEPKAQEDNNQKRATRNQGLDANKGIESWASNRALTKTTDLTVAASASKQKVTTGGKTKEGKTGVCSVQ